MTYVLIPGTKRFKNSSQEMKFFIKGFYRKCDQICSSLGICSHLLKISLMEIFIFCAVSKGFWEISVLICSNLFYLFCICFKNADLSKKQTWWNLAAQSFILLSIFLVNELFENQNIDRILQHKVLYYYEFFWLMNFLKTKTLIESCSAKFYVIINSSG